MRNIKKALRRSRNLSEFYLLSRGKKDMKKDQKETCPVCECTPCDCHWGDQ